MDNVAISEDGKLSLKYFPADPNQSWGIIPAPMMTEIAREAVVKKAMEDLWLQGYWVNIDGRVKNKAFDKGEEKTSTALSWRYCHTEDEAKFVIGKVQKLIKKGN